MVGTTLGHFRIESQLGEGGMGVVYRATDTQLGRQVALKFVRGELIQDPVSSVRFEREARMLASMNHPNIAAIHGIEQADGRHMLVLEYVSGETLAERLAAGRLPVREALAICRDVAEALEAAHEKGIIHRDLKPANIKITPDNTVKVLDFGLAKPVAAGAVAAGAGSTTLTMDATQQGAIAGTAAYMSPEQARGRDLDARTDVWAFGCVLYETLTGKRAFAGDSVTDVLAAVIEREPDWKALPASLPGNVECLLRRCLSKEPKSRLRHAGDARLELEDALAGRVPAAAAEPAAAFRKVVLGAGAGLLAGALAIYGLGSLLWRDTVPPPRVVRFAVNFPPGDANMPYNGRPMAFSPDGSKIAYMIASKGVFLRGIDEVEGKLIPASNGLPFFSPDGRWLAFWHMPTFSLRKVALSGGAPVTITQLEGGGVAGASWGPDDTIVLAWFDLLTVPAAGGTPKVLLKVDEQAGERIYRLPYHLPGGHAVLFTIGMADIETFDDARIGVLDLRTGKKKVIIEGGTCARYSPTGHVLYARGGKLLAVPFDPDRLEVTGQPFPVLDNLFMSVNSGMAAYALSDRGDLVYATGIVEGGERLPVWVDRQGGATPLPLPLRSYLHPRISPDEKQLAIEIEGPAHDSYIYDLARGVLSKVTFDGASHFPMWTPKGDRITYRSWRTGRMTMWWMPADRSGPSELMAKVGWSQSPDSWSPDGQAMLFTLMRPQNLTDVYVLSMEGGERKPRPLIETKFQEGSPKFSPDGKWLAYCSNESGKPQVYVTPFPGPGPKIQVSIDGGIDPIWRRKGGELYYREGDKLMVVEARTQPAFTCSKPRKLWEGHYSPGMGSSCGSPGVTSANYDVTGDGERFIMIQDKDLDARFDRLHVVLGWTQELKRLAEGRKP